MTQRWAKIAVWSTFPAAFLIAYLVSCMARHGWAKSPADSLLYAILAFILVHLASALLLYRMSEPKEAAKSHRPDQENRPRPIERRLRIQLSKDAAEALQAIMRAESDRLPPSAVINDMLITHQRALRRKLLCKW